MPDDEVVETPSARRRFLMISEVTATQDSGFPGRRLGEVDKQGAIRVVGLRRHNETEYHWNVADRRRPLKAGDSIIVATTRTGLAQLHSSDG